MRTGSAPRVVPASLPWLHAAGARVRCLRGGPLAPALLPALLLLVLLGLARAGLFLVYHGRLIGLDDPGTLFLIGLRIDGALAAYLSFVPVLLLSLGKRVVTRLRWLLIAYWTLVLALALFLELATIPFINEFDARPNRLLFEYLAHPREVFRTLWSDQGLALLLVLLVTGAAAAAVARWLRALVLGYRPWSAWRRTAALVPTLLVLFLAARGTLDHRPLNISTAAFSDNQLANQLALDSSYSLLYSLYTLHYESDPSQAYGSMPVDEMLSLVGRAAGIAPQDSGPGVSPLRHHQRGRYPRERPPNLVIVLEESLGAEFVGCLGGLPLTPHLDRLSSEGMLLRNLYATGVRTVRGIEAVVAGFPPTPSRSVVKLERSQHGFFTLGMLLQDRGYETEFIYGGQSHFDNMRGFLRNNGFARIYDEPTFPETAFHGTWGVSDEDLFLEADRIFRAHAGRPFFSLILTTSNHTPFDFPAGRIALYEQPAATRLNAMKYADHALGRFFDLASRSDYYADTIFLIVADHNTRTYGNDLVPIAKFKIPGLILGPGVPRTPYDRVASQLDLGPTLLDLMGLEVDHPMIGRSLVGPADEQPDRAIMQFGNSNAYMSGDRVVVLQPAMAPLQFRYDGLRLEPATLDPQLARLARAHALLPGWLYRNRCYR